MPQEKELLDIYGMYYEPWWLQPIFLYSMTGIIVGVAIYGLYRWYKKSYIIEQSYQEKALKTLDLLALSDHDSYQNFYVVMTKMLKEYMSARYDKNYSSMTDSEFLKAVKGTSDIDQWVYDDIKKICDDVVYIKFAQQSVIKGRMEEAVLLARNIVMKTEEKKDS